MFPLSKLLILLLASDKIQVVALPAPTRVASAASVFMGRDRVLPLSTTNSQPVLSISGLDTRSRQLEQSESQQQQTADPAPCDMFTGIPGPTDDANGVVYATKSTIASSQMNATVTPDATTSAETITRGTQTSFIVVATPEPSSQDRHWSSSTEFAAEPTSTVTIASSRTKVAVTSDATTSAETITPGSSSSTVAAEPTNAIRLTIMISSTIGANAATETLSASLPYNDTSSTTLPTSSFPIATTMTMAMTTESGEMECLDEKAAMPKSRGGGSRGHKSYDGCQIESSSAGTSDPSWGEMILLIISIPLALLLWIGSIYAFAMIMMLGCKSCRSRPRDPTEPVCETVRHGRCYIAMFGVVGLGEDLETRAVTLSLECKEQDSTTS